jgi:hypothetical protein
MSHNSAQLGELMAQPNPSEIVKEETRRLYKRWASRLAQELAEPEVDYGAVKALIETLNNVAKHVDVANAASIESFHRQMNPQTKSRSVTPAAPPNFKSFRKRLEKSLVKL